MLVTSSQHKYNDGYTFAFCTDENDLQFVVRLLSGFANKWEKIGQVLTVTNLPAIKTKHRENHQRCLFQMLHAWMSMAYDRTQYPELPCWWRLVWAVADKMGGNSYHMAKLYAKRFSGKSLYCRCMHGCGSVSV